MPPLPPERGGTLPDKAGGRSIPNSGVSVISGKRHMDPTTNQKQVEFKLRLAFSEPPDMRLILRTFMYKPFYMFIM